MTAPLSPRTSRLAIPSLRHHSARASGDHGAHRPQSDGPTGAIVAGSPTGWRATRSTRYGRRKSSPQQPPRPPPRTRRGGGATVRRPRRARRWEPSSRPHAQTTPCRWMSSQTLSTVRWPSAPLNRFTSLRCASRVRDACVVAWSSHWAVQHLDQPTLVEHADLHVCARAWMCVYSDGRAAAACSWRPRSQWLPRPRPRRRRPIPRPRPRHRPRSPRLHRPPCPPRPVLQPRRRPHPRLRPPTCPRASVRAERCETPYLVSLLYTRAERYVAPCNAASLEGTVGSDGCAPRVGESSLPHEAGAAPCWRGPLGLPASAWAPRTRAAACARCGRCCRARLSMSRPALKSQCSRSMCAAAPTW